MRHTRLTASLLALLLMLSLTACRRTAAPAWTQEAPELSERLYINELYNVYLPLAEETEIREKAAGMLWDEPEEALGFDEAAAALRAAMTARKESVAVRVSLGEQKPDETLIRQLFDAACAYTGKPDEGDYLFENVVWYFVADDGVSFRASGANGEALIRYAFGYADTAEEEEAVGAWASETLAGLSLDGLDELDTLRAVYGFLCTHVEYDYSYKHPTSALIHSFSAYNASQSGKAVCLGFALSACRLLVEAGLDTRVVVSSPMGHAYNLVRVDGQYYFIDATWDSSYYPSLRYFLRGEPQWLANHYYYREREDGSFDYQVEIHDLGDFLPVPIAQCDHPAAGNSTPEFLEQPENLTAAAGEEVTLYARATEDVNQMVWQKYDEQSGIWEDYGAPGESCEATLTLTADETLNGASFRCCCYSAVYTRIRIYSVTATLTLTPTAPAEQ